VGISKEPRRRPRGSLEREVLACLAAAGKALTPAEVLAETGGGLAYTTVMTTLSRLHDKGVLDRRPAGRAYAYSLARDPVGAQSEAVAQRMHRLLEAGDDRARVLARFVADLDPEDERLLADLLSDLRDRDAAPDAGGSARERTQR
jgi:predicted transcriptional regulator